MSALLSDEAPDAPPVSRDGRRIALVLQGGGALGADQAGWLAPQPPHIGVVVHELAPEPSGKHD